MSEPVVLLEVPSPNDNGVALVEQDDRVACFYLMTEIEGEKRIRTCWVRNLQPAPDVLDVAGMREGIPPMMPGAHCNHPDGAVPLDANSLRIVWAEEGDAAALYESSELLAVIPSWSGSGGFDGFARDCIGSGPLAWELAASNISHERYAKADAYWRSWDDESIWIQYRDDLLGCLQKAFGQQSRYFAIDGGQWPPKALAWFNHGPSAILSTVGVSMRSQPAVELSVEDPSVCRRIELGVCLDKRIGDESIKAVAAYISGQSGLPWNHNTWLGHGHTLPADVFDQLSAGTLPFALLSIQHPATSQVSLPTFRGDPVSILWMIPISVRERELAMQSGSEALLERLWQLGAEPMTSLARAEVI
jgi:hypothetical protein